MLNMIDDGVWCNKCKTFHPTLFWHEKYGEEKSQEGIISRLTRDAEERPGMFGFNDNISADDKKKILDEIIKTNLEHRDIIDANEGKCVVCGYLTSFISKKTGRHVCSDQCLYRENGWREEATGETIVFE